MATPIQQYYKKRGEILVKNLKGRHFDAWYCDTKEEALAKALELIPEGSSVGWGGAMSAQQIGLMTALHEGNYNAIDRDLAKGAGTGNERLYVCGFLPHRRQCLEPGRPDGQY